MTDRPEQGDPAPWGADLNAWLDEQIDALEVAIAAKISSVGVVNLDQVRFETLPWVDPTHPTYGAVGDGSTDDTIAIQAAIDAAIAGGYELVFPPLDFLITDSLVWENARGFHVRGSSNYTNGTKFTWAGSSGIPAFRFFGCRDALIENIHFQSSAAATLHTAVESETRTGSVATRLMFRNVTADGTTSAGLQYGFRTVTGTGGNANNDMFEFHNCIVTNYTTAAWSFEHSQSKGHVLYSCQYNNGAIGIATDRATNEGGSFVAHHFSGGNASSAVFALGNPNDYIIIYGGNHENVARLLVTGGPGGSAFPVKLDGVRCATNQLHADNKLIIYKYSGLTLMNNVFGQGTTDAMEIEVTASSDAEKKRVVSINNFYSTSLATPFTGTVPVETIGDAVSADGGSTWSALSVNRLQGTGSPEGAVEAIVGSTYHRLDGGAGTCLYVKESGAGTNTGWVAK